MKNQTPIPEIQTEKKDHGHAPADEQNIDEGVEESFPASDPPATSVPGADRPQPKKSDLRKPGAQNPTADSERDSDA